MIKRTKDEGRRTKGFDIGASALFRHSTPVRLGPFVLRHSLHLSRNVNMRSPSETTASFTTQLQRAFASRLLRALINSALMKSVSPGKTGLRNFTSSALMN